MNIERRYDFCDVREDGPAAPVRTPQGGLRLPAYLTRIGVLTYRKQDGSTIRELRHPDEVFAKDSLASLVAAPVTVSHPGKVTSKTWKRDSVGHVGETVAPAADRFVGADLFVQDENAVNRVLTKGPDQLREISCGYDCKVVPESGEYNGEKYDARQTEIRYNHVAMGPRGWGRAGSEVRMRMDSAKDPTEAGETSDIKYAFHVTETSDLDRTDHTEQSESMDLKELQTRFDALTAERDALKAQADATRGERDTLKTRADSLEAELATAKADSSTEKLDTLVAARVTLMDSARSILGADFTGKDKDGKTLSDVAVMTACVAAGNKDFKSDGETPDYVRGCFAQIVAQSAKARSGLSLLRTDAKNVTASAGGEADVAVTARQKMIERNANAYKGSKS